MKVYEPEENIDLPSCDILTFLFGNIIRIAARSEHTRLKICTESKWCARATEDTKIHVEAANEANSVTKAQARDISKRVAHVFRNRYGIGKNGPGKDVVVATSSGNPFIPVLFYSVINAGGVYSGASTAFQVSELVRQIKDSDAQLLLCSEEFEERTIVAGKQCGIERDRILVLDYKTPLQWTLIQSSNREAVLDVISGPKLQWHRFNNRKEQHGTTTCILYSSGTTGLPKGVRISHLNLVACNMCVMNVSKKYLARVAREKPNDKFHFKTIAHLPMAHIAGIAWYTLNSFYLGGTTYWMQKYDFDSFIEYSRKYRTTAQFSVPPIWLTVAKSPKVTDHFDSVQVAASGAAPMGPELAREVSGKLGRGKTMISQFWGTSETTGSITGVDWEVVDDTFSVGSAFPNTRLRFLDEEDRDVEPGKPGEVLVGGPIVCQGYLNRPEANRDSFLNGFYRTGDIGIWKDGLVYIVDRKKELIKYKGTQVAPAELEAVLVGHPKVNDAAVIGVADPTDSTNEVPRAYVVGKPGTNVNEQEIKDYVKEQLSAYKQLRGGVVFVDEIPKSPSGKILRKDLRARVAAEARSSGPKL